MSFEIIDFHVHPFNDPKYNICSHQDVCEMNADKSKEMFRALGVTKICGSVIGEKDESGAIPWEGIKECNNVALELRDYYGDFYVPGFHVHPDHIDESIAEIHRMKNEGVKLVGELVPYYCGWSDYSCEGFSVLLDEIGKHNMIVNFHSKGEDEMDEMVRNHKDVLFVAAHPGEYKAFMRHIERMKLSENYYLDLSGYGIFRHGMLRKAIDTFGIDRILFGSDFPTCNAAMYVGGVLLDELITDTEKEKIFSLNAKRILGI